MFAAMYEALWSILPDVNEEIWTAARTEARERRLSSLH